MKKRWLFLCLICLTSSVTNVYGQRRKAGTKQTQAAKVDVQAKVKELMSTYQYGPAIEELEKEIAAAEKRKKNTDELQAMLEEAENKLQALRGTEKITFIDSFVVDKDKILDVIRINPENGRIGAYEDFFESNDARPKDGWNVMAYMSELGDKIYFSYPDKNNNGKLYACTQLNGDNWDKPALLRGLGDGEDSKINPFVLSDGTTLYYASQDEEGLGGYDIYVTRYSSEHGTYLKPENIGMPFNSPANDYLYVIDETNKLGWFATDRNQPEGKVCIYVFVPNNARTTYAYEEDGDNTAISNAARIASIRDTWFDRNMVLDAKERLKEALAFKEQARSADQFRFVVDDAHIYTQLKHFKSAVAGKKCQQWQEMTERLKLIETTLDKLRTDYAGQTKEQRKKMEAGILKMEKESETLLGNIKQIENEIRSHEQQALTKK